LRFEKNGEYDRALASYERAASRGHPLAIHNLACMYETGKGTREPDLPRAIHLWQLAAKKGVDRAQYCLGLAYLNGKGVERDPARARELLGIAAEQKNANACYALGVVLENGAVEGEEEDEDAAEGDEAKTAEEEVEVCLPVGEDPPNGVTAKNKDLGKVYAIRPNWKASLHYYRRAAALGHRKAAVNLASLEAKRRGGDTRQIYEEAEIPDMENLGPGANAAARRRKSEASKEVVRMLKEAAEAGDGLACWNMAVLSTAGIEALQQREETRSSASGASDSSRAAEVQKQRNDWLEKAAESGQPKAQVNVAISLLRAADIADGAVSNRMSGTTFSGDSDLSIDEMRKRAKALLEDASSKGEARAARVLRVAEAVSKEREQAKEQRFEPPLDLQSQASLESEFDDVEDVHGRPTKRAIARVRRAVHRMRAKQEAKKRRQLFTTAPSADTDTGDVGTSGSTLPRMKLNSARRAEDSILRDDGDLDDEDALSRKFVRQVSMASEPTG